MKKLILTTLAAGILAIQSSPVLAEPASERITVIVRGHGPDVVLIPGLACSTAVWDGTAVHLEARYRLHLVQVAGFGGSPAKANSQGPVLQPTVDAIDTYIRTNHLKAPKIIGHSMGGLMGMLLADQHPDDVSKVLVVDSFPFFGVLMGAKDSGDVAPQAASMLDTILNETQDAYADGEDKFLSKLVKSTDGRKAAIAWAVASDKSVVARSLYEVMTTDIRPRLSGIKTPVVMLYPFDSTAGYPQSAVDGIYQDSYASLPNKTLTRIDNSYHFIMLDQPEVFEAKVDAFLK